MADTPAPASRALRWTRISLLASLAVNLAVAGLVAGAFLGDPPRDRNPDRRPGARELALGPFYDALPRSDRQALVQAMRRESGALREGREALRRQFEAFLAALRADPYDAEAVRQLFAGQQSKLGERQALGRRLLLDHLEAMAPDQRFEYADRLDSLLRRPPPKR